MCFCEDVVFEWVGGRGEVGIVNFVGFCTFRIGFCWAENSVKMTSKFHLVQFVRELSRTLVPSLPLPPSPLPLSSSEERERTELRCWFELGVSRAREVRLRRSFRRCGAESRGFAMEGATRAGGLSTFY